MLPQAPFFYCYQWSVKLPEPPFTAAGRKILQLPTNNMLNPAYYYFFFFFCVQGEVKISPSLYWNKLKEKILYGRVIHKLKMSFNIVWHKSQARCTKLLFIKDMLLCISAQSLKYRVLYITVEKRSISTIKFYRPLQ